MIEHKNIHEAINAVMEEVGYVKKQKSNDVKYTFAGEAALISALRPAMVEHGIYMHVSKIENVSREHLTTKSGTQMVNTLTTGVVRFTHAQSGTSVDSWATGEGFDSGDKSANKAMTGLYKYAMRQTFCIETGDDPDTFSAERKAEKKPDANRAELVRRYNALSDKASAAKLTDIPILQPEMSIEEIKAEGIKLNERLTKAGK